MKEVLLHYLWRIKTYNRIPLHTTTGEEVSVHQEGIYNEHDGPDFSNSRVRIGKMLWSGNVEMHVKSSDWLKHQHQFDPAYDNIILHVVYEEDIPIYRLNGDRIPCVELKGRIPNALTIRCQQLYQSKHWVPCQPQLPQVKDLVKQLWLQRLAAERLEAKTVRIRQWLEKTTWDWEGALYYFLAIGMGMKVNAGPFEQLARSLPLILLQKHRSNTLQIEALLFGQAGFLEIDFTESYPQQLQKEYQFLQHKYNLRPLKSSSWKFARLRPANFPTIRIAQLASLVTHRVHLFDKLLAASTVEEIENALEIKLSPYWYTHYRFDQTSIKRKKRLGRASIHLLISNVIAPMIFLYGKHFGEDRHQEKALGLLEALPAEQNSVIEQWKTLGMEAASAFESQALLQLKRYYCDQKRCLNCSIGHSILKEEKQSELQFELTRRPNQ